jgi:hypothetical protein
MKPNELKEMSRVTWGQMFRSVIDCVFNWPLVVAGIVVVMMLAYVVGYRRGKLAEPTDVLCVCACLDDSVNLVQCRANAYCIQGGNCFEDDGRGEQDETWR